MKLRLSIFCLMFIGILSIKAQSVRPEAIYSVESQLVAETLADVAYLITDAV